MKRIYRHVLRKYDLDHDKSLVRELEMHVEAIATEPGWVIQFWRDMDTYGLKESITYLRNSHPRGDFTSLDEFAAKIVKAFA